MKSIMFRGVCDVGIAPLISNKEFNCGVVTILAGYMEPGITLLIWNIEVTFFLVKRTLTVLK